MPPSWIIAQTAHEFSGAVTSLDIDLPTRLLMCFSLSPSILIFVGILCCVASTLIRASTSLFLLYPHGSAHTLTS